MPMSAGLLSGEADVAAIHRHGLALHVAVGAAGWEPTSVCQTPSF